MDGQNPLDYQNPPSATEGTVSIMRRATAWAGAILVFGFVFMLFDFVAMHMTEGLSDTSAVLAMVVCALIALVAARGSYVRSMAKKNPPRSWRIS